MEKQFKFINEKNISKFVFILPSIAIIITAIIITILIVKSDYENLNFEIKQIRETYVENQKKNMKLSVDEVKRFIKYSPYNNDKKLVEKSTLNFLKNIIPKEKGYIFIIDDLANVVYHPNIKKETNMSALEDKNGTKIARDIIKNAKSSPTGAYLSYYWYKSDKTHYELKTTYVYYLKKWNWIISTGTYLEDINKEINKKVLLQEKMTKERVLKTIIASILISSIILIFSYFFSKIIKSILLEYRRTVKLKEKNLIKLNYHLKKLAKNEKVKRSKKEEELEIIYKDNLTGLPNRLKLSNLLKNESYSKLIILNINRFTDINNFYSSSIADKLLKTIANFLVKLFEDKKDIKIFKLPSDEFAILSNEKDLNKDEFIKICKLAIELIESKPFIIDKNEIIVSITGGISFTCNNTFINADSALKKAKEKNKDFLYIQKMII